MLQLLARADNPMSDIDAIDFIRSQLTIARWHLERSTAIDVTPELDHRAEAVKAYETAIDLLPLVKLSGRRRVELVIQLADLRNLLREAGAEL